jgi:hypothetical protein
MGGDQPWLDGFCVERGVIAPPGNRFDGPRNEMMTRFPKPGHILARVSAH